MRVEDAGDQPWGPVLCICGGVLAEAMDATHVVISGVRLPFRRKTDHLTCPRCTYTYSVVELRKAHARFAGSDAAAPEEQEARPGRSGRGRARWRGTPTPR